MFRRSNVIASTLSLCVLASCVPSPRLVVYAPQRSAAVPVAPARPRDAVFYEDFANSIAADGSVPDGWLATEAVGLRLFPITRAGRRGVARGLSADRGEHAVLSPVLPTPLQYRLEVGLVLTTQDWCTGRIIHVSFGPTVVRLSCNDVQVNDQPAERVPAITATNVVAFEREGDVYAVYVNGTRVQILRDPSALPARRMRVVWRGEGAITSVALLARGDRSPAEARAASASRVETFESTPEGTLPRGWSGDDTLIVRRIGNGRAMVLTQQYGYGIASAALGSGDADVDLELVASITCWNAPYSQLSVRIGRTAVVSDGCSLTLVTDTGDPDHAREWNEISEAHLKHLSVIRVVRRGRFAQLFLNDRRLVATSTADPAPSLIAIGLGGNNEGLAVHELAVTDLGPPSANAPLPRSAEGGLRP